MPLPPAAPDDLAAVKAWFAELAEHVRAVDFAAARHLFAEDFVAFGTFTDFMIGRELAEENQWRNVWPTIDNFAWRLNEAKAMVSPDRLFAVGLAVWDSTGYFPDGRPFDRKGRATVSFALTSAIAGSRPTRTCRCFAARLTCRTARSRRRADPVHANPALS